MSEEAVGERRQVVVHAGSVFVPEIGGHPLHAYWLLIAPRLRGLFLPPQRRFGDEALTWSWAPPKHGPGFSPAEVMHLRERLRSGLAAFAAGALEPAADGEPAERQDLLRQLSQVLDRWGQSLLQRPDHEVAAYLAHTRHGVMIHSWGLAEPGRETSADGSGPEAASMPRAEGASTAQRDRPRWVRTALILLLLGAIGGVGYWWRSGLEAERVTLPPPHAGQADAAAAVVPAELGSTRRKEPAHSAAGGAAGQRRSGSAPTARLPVAGRAGSPAGGVSHGPSGSEAFQGRDVAPGFASSGAGAGSAAGAARPAGAMPVPLMAADATAAASGSNATNQATGAAPTGGAAAGGHASGGRDDAVPPAQASNPPVPNAPTYVSRPSSALSPGARPSASTAHVEPDAPRRPRPDRMADDPLPSADVAEDTRGTYGTASVGNEAAPEDRSTGDRHTPDEGSEDVTPLAPVNPTPGLDDPEAGLAGGPSVDQAGEPEADPPTIGVPHATIAASHPPAPPSTSVGGETVQVRLSGWRSELWADEILPTMPRPAGSAPSTGILRASRRREREKVQPPFFQSPRILIGVSVAWPASSTGPVPAWRQGTGVVPIVCTIEGDRAEIGWVVALPANATWNLGTSDGQPLATVSFDGSRRTLTATSAPPHRLVPWIAVESSETTRPIEWRVAAGPAGVGASRWRTRAGAGGWRTDLVGPSSRAAVVTRTLALIDSASGWALVVDIEEHWQSSRTGISR